MEDKTSGKDYKRGSGGGRHVMHEGHHSGTFEHPNTVTRAHGHNPHSTPEAKPNICATPVAPTEHKLAEFMNKESVIPHGPMTNARLERKVITSKKFI